MVGPKGLPRDIATRYEALFKKAHESADFKTFMDERGFEMVWANATEFRVLHEEGQRRDRRHAEADGPGEEVASRPLPTRRVAACEPGGEPSPSSRLLRPRKPRRSRGYPGSFPALVH